MYSTACEQTILKVMLFNATTAGTCVDSARDSMKFNPFISTQSKLHQALGTVSSRIWMGQVYLETLAIFCMLLTIPHFSLLTPILRQITGHCLLRVEPLFADWQSIGHYGLCGLRLWHCSRDNWQPAVHDGQRQYEKHGPLLRPRHGEFFEVRQFRSNTFSCQFFRQIIQKFRQFATLHNVHMTLVIHPRKEDDERLTSNSIFGGAKATQEADNVILLQEEEVNARLKRKYIQVVKNRFSGDLGVVPLFFNRPTVTFSKKIFAKNRAQTKQHKTSSPSLKTAADDNPKSSRQME